MTTYKKRESADCLKPCVSIYQYASRPDTKAPDCRDGLVHTRSLACGAAEAEARGEGRREGRAPSNSTQKKMKMPSSGLPSETSAMGCMVIRSPAPPAQHQKLSSSRMSLPSARSPRTRGAVGLADKSAVSDGGEDQGAEEALFMGGMCQERIVSSVSEAVSIVIERHPFQRVHVRF